jgi:xanthine/CO dehydrogenase XdhC/CoxF family maturation factor
VGLGCRGIIDVLIEPVDAEDRVNPVALLKVCSQQESSAALAVVTDSQSESLPVGTRFLKSEGLNLTSGLEPGEEWNILEECAAEALGEAQNFYSKAVLSDGSPITIFVELIKPPLHLILFGSNYDVIPLLEIGQTLGWKCTVTGNVKKFGKEVFKMAAVVAKANVGDDLAGLKLGDVKRVAAVLMAHDYATDFSNLKKLLPTAIPYIGMLGPRKRTERVLEDLEKEGIPLSPDDEKRLHGPAGLDIGAASPESIALSIAAGILAYFGGREGGFLKYRTGPIYDANHIIHAS